MDSFVLSETFKYLYLLFAGEELGEWLLGICGGGLVDKRSPSSSPALSVSSYDAFCRHHCVDVGWFFELVEIYRKTSTFLLKNVEFLIHEVFQSNYFIFDFFFRRHRGRGRLRLHHRGAPASALPCEVGTRIYFS